ncbi:MAG: hypothetical protein LUI13_08995 [Lachnospiraceae bacterium]|nr:hypothetical protein [Lachnospiraceae bacterium]
MLQFIMEKNVLLYLLAAACVVGVVSQMILRRIYDGLLKDTRSDGGPEGRFLQQLRQRFQYCSHLNERVGDVQALIQKSLIEYRVFGFSLHGFARLGGGCLAVSLLCAFAGTMVRVQGGATVVTGNAYFWLGAAAVLLMAAAYGIADTGYRSRTLLICLTDYLENSGILSVSEEDELPEMEYETTVERTPIVSVEEGRRAKRRMKAETATAASVRGQKSKAELLRLQRDGGDSLRAQREGEDSLRAQRDRSEGKEPLTRTQRDKNETRDNLARVKAGMKESAASDAEQSGADLLRQMDPKDQERLVREVLNEFLAR